MSGHSGFLPLGPNYEKNETREQWVSGLSGFLPLGPNCERNESREQWVSGHTGFLPLGPGCEGNKKREQCDIKSIRVSTPLTLICEIDMRCSGHIVPLGVLDTAV